MFEKILQSKVKFPKSKKIQISESAEDLVKKLLHKNPQKRLGCKRGMKEILEHVWFADIDIDSILKKKAKSPFVPNLQDLMTPSKPLPKEEPISENRKKIVKKYAPQFEHFDTN